MAGNRRRRANRVSIGACLSIFIALSSCFADTPDIGLPVAATPEVSGFSTKRLLRVESYLHHAIDAGEYAGAVWLVARDGKVIQHGTVGYRDIAAHAPMTEDTVFAIASMTKLITTTVALSLLEEGRFNLDDPIALYLPKLAKLQVLVGGTADVPQLTPAVRPVTIRHLLTQTSGFSYGFFDGEPLRTLHERAQLWESRSLEEFVVKAAKLPLKHQPGEAWTYGINTDLLGALIERLTGRTLGEVMQERVFDPLGMKDTGFLPPKDSAARLAKTYDRKPGEPLTEDPQPMNPLQAQGTFVSGGGGLFSTLHDYARFAQMLLNGGELEGARVLGRKTMELMTSNQVNYLNPRPRDRFVPPGFGFGVRVRLESQQADMLGSPGAFGWEGIRTTYVSIDPHERMVLILLLQHQPYDDGGVFEKFTNTVYQALEK